MNLVIVSSTKTHKTCGTRAGSGGSEEDHHYSVRLLCFGIIGDIYWLLFRAVQL